MAKRKFTLTEKEVGQFKRRESTVEDVREIKRLQAVRLYGTGKATSEIIEMVGCSWRSLMDWCQAYRQNGLAGLKSKWQGQNAAKLSAKQRAEISERVNSYRPDQILPPELRSSRGEFWTISDLKVAVKYWYQASWRSESTYRLLIHECGFSYQRTEKQYRSRPNELRIADFEAELAKK